LASSQSKLFSIEYVFNSLDNLYVYADTRFYVSINQPPTCSSVYKVMSKTIKYE